MALRILQIIPTLERSGPAKQLTLLASGLDPGKFEVHVCALARGGAYERALREAGIATFVLGKRWTIDPLAFSRLLVHIRRLRPDVVHTWLEANSVHGRVAARLRGVPHLVSSMQYVDRRRSGLAWTLDRHLARVTDRLIANSPAVRDDAVQHGLPERKFVVIPGGVPTALSSDVSREQLFQELELPEGTRLIGVIGRHRPAKRTTEMIWAADLLRVLHDNMRLLVIGDGPQRPQLERFSRLASDLDHIRFLGEQEVVGRILPHLDVLWHAGTAEGQSNAIMEAMAAGVPVVACDVPAHRVLIVDGESGFLVPVAARAARVRVTDQILNDRQLAERLGTAARQRMTECFTVERMVGEYAELYEELLAASS